MVEVDNLLLLLRLSSVLLQLRLILFDLFFELLHLQIAVPVQVVVLLLLLVLLELAALRTTRPAVLLRLSGFNCNWSIALNRNQLIA